MLRSWVTVVYRFFIIETVKLFLSLPDPFNYQSLNNHFLCAAMCQTGFKELVKQECPEAPKLGSFTLDWVMKMYLL